MREVSTGRTFSFDEQRGLGEVETDAGARYSFHCTAIADGTRTISAGVRVEFVLVAGPLGRYEADAIRARP